MNRKPLKRFRQKSQRWKLAEDSIVQFKRKYALIWKRRIYETPTRESGESEQKTMENSRIREILPTVRLFIAWGYFMGFHPFNWDDEASRMILLTKNWELCRWGLRRMITLLCVTTIGFQTVVSLIMESSHLYRWEDMFGMIFFMLLVLGECLHYNTMRRKEVALAFFNGVLLHFNQIEDRLNRSGSTFMKKSNHTALILKIGFCIMLITSGIQAVFYTFYCKYHILYRIYPGICASTTESFLNHRWDAAVLPLAILQFILTGQIFGSGIIYFLAIVVYIFVGNELLTRIQEEEGCNALDQVLPGKIAIITATWSTGFRSWQIMHNLFDDLVGDFALPSFIAVMVVQAITTLFSVLSVTAHHRQFSVPFIIFLIFICLLDIILVALFGSRVLAFTENSWKWLESRRRHLIKQHKLNAAFLRSSPKLSIRIGSFGAIQRSTILTILYIVVDRSITIQIWNE